MPLRTLYRASWFVKASFIICFFVIFFVAGVTYKNMSDLSESSELVEHRYEIGIQLEMAMSYLKDAETGQRGFIITKDSVYLDPYFSGRENINNSLAALKQLLQDNPTQKKSLRELTELIDERLANFQEAQRFLVQKNNDIESPKFIPIFSKGKVLMDEIRQKIKEMTDLESLQLHEKQKEYKNNLKLTPIFLYIIILLTLVIMVIAYRKIMNDVRMFKIKNEQLELFRESANLSEIISKHGRWKWDIEDDSFEFSDNLYRLLGEEPHSFPPTVENFLKYVHPDDVEKVAEQVAQMREEKDLPFIFYRVVHKNGNIRHLKAYGRTVTNKWGKQNLLGTTTDITDEIANFKALEERNIELERNNRELSAFNHVASHDLQEPLRKIQTFLSRLEEKEEENLSATGVKYMSRIKNAATRMRLLIDDLLQFSRTNKADKIFEISDINVLFEEAMEDLAEKIHEKEATIHADSFPKMYVIPFQIQQLFINLVGNSLKYKAEDRAPKITINYEKVSAEGESLLSKTSHENYHKITYKDNGIGFDNEFAEKIFILFHRLHNRNEYSGTGIGLSICKKIVQNHRGYIFASGEEGVGATFTIYLPIT